MKKNIIITGGQMYNKGAEAMVYLAVDQLKRKYPESNIVVLSSQDYKRPQEEKNKFNFEILPRDSHMMIALSNGKMSLIDFIKYLKVIFRKKRPYIKEMNRLQKIFSNTHMIVDISGFALSSQFSDRHSLSYLARIEIAKNYNIPMYIMPQSFGPFDYKDSQQNIKNKIRENLKYPKVVFAREKEGFELLQKEIGLTNNLRYSMDSVLLSKKIDFDNVFKVKPKIKEFKNISGVAIVPNMKTFKHGEKEEILHSYKTIIDILLSKNKNVYIVRHSHEDIIACELIKELYKSNESVLLIKDDMSSLEFDDLVKQFDFIVGSRFHSIVHAYKNSIPSIAIGWATKYRELLKTFEQDDYLFDVRKGLNNNQIKSIILKMIDSYEIESETITEHLNLVQSSNPYSVIK